MNLATEQERDRAVVIYCYPEIETFLRQIPAECMVYEHNERDNKLPSKIIGIDLRLHFQPNGIVLANVDAIQKLTRKQQIQLANTLALEALALIEKEITEIRSRLQKKN